MYSFVYQISYSFFFWYFLCSKLKIDLTSFCFTAGPTYELWVGTENMSANKKDWAIYYAKQALKTHGMTTSAAKEIRYKMQGRYDGNWNSIIGPCNYHYWITFKNNHHLYFSLGDVCIGIFRSPE